MTRKQAERIATAVGACLAVLVAGLGIWLMCSAIASFANLEWSAITETRHGRTLFGVAWLFVAGVMFRQTTE